MGSGSESFQAFVRAQIAGSAAAWCAEKMSGAALNNMVPEKINVRSMCLYSYARLRLPDGSVVKQGESPPLLLA